MTVIKKWAKDEHTCQKCGFVIRKNNYYEIDGKDYHRKFKCSGIKEEKNEKRTKQKRINYQ
jgi:hypothetical protein